MAASSFSYAQAAKGLSATPSSTATPSKPSSGSATPAKDAAADIAPVASVTSWADDAEINSSAEKPSTTQETQAEALPSAPKPTGASPPAVPSAVSSPDLGASTASTVTKDDDIASLPNESSESTWENKSQASTSVDKTAEPVEKTSEKAKGKDTERAPVKPLQEAPVPVVNIWKQRADEAAKVKAAKSSVAKPASSVSTPTAPNGFPQGPSAATTKKSKSASGTDSTDSKEKASTENKWKSRDDDKVGQSKKDARSDLDSDKTARPTKGRSYEKDVKAAPNVLPLPPDRDQEAWPTPENAVDEKKPQGKGDKVEKERKEGSSGKQEWVKIPYTPTVKFNTPMPSTTTSRRGGRGGGRGGAQNNSRSAGFTADKDASLPVTLSNGDQPKRGRPDGPAARDVSPKDKRGGGASSPFSKDKALNGEKNPKTSEAETSRRPSVITDLATGSQGAGQGNSFPRQYPSGRPNKGRRGDFYGSSDRRKDGDHVSPTKENAGSHDRRTSTATQIDAADSQAFQEGQNGQSRQGPNDRRSYGSISGRGGRGGPRGSRGNFQNGYTNGHTPSQQSSSSFPLRSPTSFTPEQNGFSGRRWGSGPRAQPVAADNIYHGVGFPGGPQQIPPVQGYSIGAPIDFAMLPPMAAPPFTPYAVEPYSLFNLLTQQLDYYFSLDNLLKDMYLRKHMDSKGFVFLTFVASFRRIQKLTTDVELIRLACHQSQVIEFRVGHDGKDRLRCKEEWQNWVLDLNQRDPSAQNDGPEELHQPPIPQPHGFDQSGFPRFADIPAGSPNGQRAFENEGQYPLMNGFYPGAAQHGPVDNSPNGTSSEGLNGPVVPNGHPSDISTQAVSGQPDSFSDEQVDSLTVVVRNRSSIPNASEESRTSKANGLGPCQDVESRSSDESRRPLSPLAQIPSLTPIRLYWVKDKDAPVDFLPSDSAHESYHRIRLKALQQRQNAPFGSCPYDMDVLYQFWSHFLIRNFNTRMYDEFRHFAFEDASLKMSDVGLRNLIKFYGESLLSSQNPIRECVARHYIALVKSENEHRRPAFKLLRSVFRNENLSLDNRQQIDDILDAELRASLE